MIKLWVLAYMLTSGHFGHMNFYAEEECESAKSQLKLSLSETDNPVQGWRSASSRRILAVRCKGCGVPDPKPRCEYCGREDLAAMRQAQFNVFRDPQAQASVLNQAALYGQSMQRAQLGSAGLGSVLIGPLGPWRLF